MIRLIEMFAGIGGFRLGLEQTNNLDSSENRERQTNSKNKSASRNRYYALERDGSCSTKESGDKRSLNRGSKGQLDNEQANQGSSEGENGEGKTGVFAVENSNFRSGDNDDNRPRLQQTPTFNCVWSNDFDRYACQVYRKRFGAGELVEGDIRSIDANALPDFDLLSAGFPCQSFSVAGKRQGFEDTRGTLFYEIVRVLKAKRPRCFLLENVKGLLSHQDGETFHTILRVLSDAGYLVEWAVLNSKNFGVPQNRERVFIIGHPRNLGGREVFPVGEAHEMVAGEESDGQIVSDEASSAIHSRYGAGWRAHEQEQLVSTAVDSNYWKGADKHGQRQLVQVGSLYEGNADAGRVYSSKGVAKSLTGNAGGVGGKTGLYAIQRVPLKYLSRNQRKIEGDYSFTVDGANTGGIAYPEVANTVCDGYLLKSGHKGRGGQSRMRIRRLTPVECERLQGFPDNWTQKGLEKDGKEVAVSDTQRYKMLGNAVSVPVIKFLGGLLKIEGLS